MLVTSGMPTGRVVLRGTEGLHATSGYARMHAIDPEAFRGESVTVNSQGVSLQTFAATEHEGIRGEAEIAAHPRDLMFMTLVTSGLLRTWDGDAQVDLEPGSVSLRIASRPHHWEFVRPSTVIRSWMPASRLPDPLKTPSALPNGPLQKTRLLTTYIALMQNLATSYSTFTVIEADYLWRAFANLEVAVLAEAVGEVGQAPGSLRSQIVSYIDAHLTDSRLGPEQIAAALGISVRYVHRVFNDGETSVGRYIRDLRLSKVEEALRGEMRISRTGVLSKRFGFSGPDQLSRAFRTRFGQTIHDYVEALPAQTPSSDSGSKPRPTPPGLPPANSR